MDGFAQLKIEAFQALMRQFNVKNAPAFDKNSETWRQNFINLPDEFKRCLYDAGISQYTCGYFELGFDPCFNLPPLEWMPPFLMTYIAPVFILHCDFKYRVLPYVLIHLKLKENTSYENRGFILEELCPNGKDWPLFNVHALEQTKPIFIFTSYVNALINFSLYHDKINVIAIGTNANKDRLLNHIEMLKRQGKLATPRYYFVEDLKKEDK